MYQTQNEEQLTANDEAQKLSYEQRKRLGIEAELMAQTVTKQMKGILENVQRIAAKKLTKALHEQQKKMIEGENYTPSTSYHLAVNLSAKKNHQLYNDFRTYRKLKGLKISEVLISLLAQWVAQAQKEEVEKLRAEFSPPLNGNSPGEKTL